MAVQPVAQPSAFEKAAIFTAAGFEREGNKYKGCPGEIGGGAEIYFVDLNGDSASEALVREESGLCYGQDEFWEVFLHSENGVWRRVLGTRGTSLILETKHNGWRDIEVMGNSASRPVFHFNGDEYVH